MTAPLPTLESPDGLAGQSLGAANGSGTVEFCADDVRVTCPLFQAEYGGANPTSALQLRFSKTDIHRALKMNRQWHSRMPQLTNWQGCLAYSAECGNVVYAVAIWGRPVAREFNGRGYIELRRMAIADDAPKNTATRMIGWMLRELRKCAEYTLAISYQDTGVHKGTIYKASGWKAVGLKKNIGTGWNTRDRNKMQSTSDKVRWEYALRESPNDKVSDGGPVASDCNRDAIPPFAAPSC